MTAVVTCGCGCGCRCGGERRDSLGLVNELGRARTADRGGLHITGLGEARDITEREEIIAGAQRTGRRRGKRGGKGERRGQRRLSGNMTGAKIDKLGSIWSNWGRSPEKQDQDETDKTR